MEAIKQILRVNKNHEVMVKVPSYIPENEVIEMIMIYKNKSNNYEQKIMQMKEAMDDTLFLNDLKGISEDFKTIDSLINIECISGFMAFLNK